MNMLHILFMHGVATRTLQPDSEVLQNKQLWVPPIYILELFGYSRLQCLIHHSRERENVMTGAKQHEFFTFPPPPQSVYSHDESEP